MALIFLYLGETSKLLGPNHLVISPETKLSFVVGLDLNDGQLLSTMDNGQWFLSLYNCIQWFSMVANHWSNDEMVTIYRWGLCGTNVKFGKLQAAIGYIFFYLQFICLINHDTKFTIYMF